MRTPSQAPSVAFNARAGPRPPRSRARRVLRPRPTPRTRRWPCADSRFTAAHSAIDSEAEAMRKGAAQLPASPGDPMARNPRLRYDPVEGAAQLFTCSFGEYLLAPHDRLNAQIGSLLQDRNAALQRALTQGVLPSRPSRDAGGDWKVPTVPADLMKPGIEISGPCSITSMFINALNPGPEGERAEGDLDDDEDSGGHRLIDTVRAAHN